jgi:hypothetical protein
LLRTLRSRPHLRLKLKRQHLCLSATPAARQNPRRRLEPRRHGRKPAKPKPAKKAKPARARRKGATAKSRKAKHPSSRRRRGGRR